MPSATEFRRAAVQAAPERYAPPVAIVDIGSNSVRLVVYEGESRVAATVQNEKSICGIGRDMVTTGRLHAEGCAEALEALARFRLIADGLSVPVREAVATAAARDASNGAEFIARAEKAWGSPIRVLAGEDEARIAAEGVIAGIPHADGLAADLGGGSLDMVGVKNGKTGRAFTLPFGPLRLMDQAKGDPDKAREIVDKGLKALPGLEATALYAVGGIWRSFARIDMEEQHYPLHVLQHYTIPRGRALRLCRLLAGLSRDSIRKIRTVSKRRAESLPYGAVVLERLIEAGGLKEVVISAYGLREGLLYARLPPTERARDPLIAFARASNARQARVPAHAQEMFDWTAPLFEGEGGEAARIREAGFDPASPLIARLVHLAGELIGMPRHLSQHVGGFVIARGSIERMVPVENAAMVDRTVIQWEKDDLDYMRMLKVDCLALGMLTCLRKCFGLLESEHGVVKTIATIATADKDDEKTYAMIQRADTVGVFQIESRAQMAMLPRHRPANFYDLVIQVAIVRPGPIQGDMVHPYLRRRNGEEEVDYPSPEFREVLKRTLGVPLFQEQVMQLAIVAADFTDGEADKLRRSMAAWKRHGGLEPHRDKLVQGMLKNGYTAAFAARIFEQIKGFGSYGFPESHAASFANLVYASCWLKCHYPAAFACALLNAQPMGFYGPSQIVQDVRRHRVAVRPVDVRFSDWDCTLEPDPQGAADARAIRLGLRMVRGCSEATALRLVAARRQRPFTDITDLCVRADLDRRHQELLADAAALRGLAGHRHRARWAVAGVEPQLPLFGSESPAERAVALPLPTQAEDTQADYARIGLSLGAHPLRQIRARLNAARCIDGKALRRQPHNSRVRVAGLVTSRQQPQTASGIIFMTLEDEHGLINVVVWRRVAEAQRRPLLQARLLAVEGQWENVEGVSHLIAHRLTDLTPLLGVLDARSRDFH